MATLSIVIQIGILVHQMELREQQRQLHEILQKAGCDPAVGPAPYYQVFEATIRGSSNKDHLIKALNRSGWGLTSLIVDGNCLSHSAILDLKSNPGLTSLTFYSLPLPKGSIASLRHLPNLRALELGFMKLDDAQFQEIIELKRLTYLHLLSAEATPVQLKCLRFSGLRYLLINNKGADDEIARELSRFPELVFLSVKSMKVSDQSIALLVDAKKLICLEVKGPGISDQVIASLRKFKFLEYAYVGGQKVTQKAIDDHNKIGRRPRILDSFEMHSLKQRMDW